MQCRSIYQFPHEKPGDKTQFWSTNTSNKTLCAILSTPRQHLHSLSLQDATHIWATLDGASWQLCSLPSPPEPGADTVEVTLPQVDGESSNPLGGGCPTPPPLRARSALRTLGGRKAEWDGREGGGRRFAQKKEAAIKIEGLVRGRQATEGYKKTKASIKLQSRMRSQWAARDLKRSKKAQAKIGAIVRGKQGRDTWRRTRELVVQLQAMERRRERRNSFRVKREGAVKLESAFRMHRQAEEFKGQKEAAVKLQSVGRAKAGREEYERQQAAALLLHNNVRRFLAMAKLEHKKLGLFSGRKRRQNSVLFKPQGDYLSARDDDALKAELKAKNGAEDAEVEIKFADAIEKYNRKGKRQDRNVVLTCKHIYFLDGKKVKSHYDIIAGQLEGCNLSKMADDFLSFSIKDDRDILVTCQHKTELVQLISEAVMAETRTEFPVSCVDSFEVKTYGSGFSRKKLETFSAEFWEDASVPAKEKWRLKISKDGKVFTVSVSPTLVTEASHPLGTPRAAKFDIMIGGRPPSVSQASAEAGKGKGRTMTGLHIRDNLSAFSSKSIASIRSATSSAGSKSEAGN